MQRVQRSFSRTLQMLIGFGLWARRQLIGRLPVGATYAAYRLIRRAPRGYLLMRAVLMREMAGRS